VDSDQLSAVSVQEKGQKMKVNSFAKLIRMADKVDIKSNPKSA
jgi:hypothetical protein